MTRAHKIGAMATRFPTKYNPVRSAYKNKIILPPGLVSNPSPAAPTPLETPAAFLPKSDKRQTLKWNESFKIDEMPPLAIPREKTYHLTPKDVQKIQSLRLEEPTKWTRKALAAEFKVSEYVIGLVSSPNAEYSAEMDSRLSYIQSQWSVKTKRARDQRERRRKMWLRDA